MDVGISYYGWIVIERGRTFALKVTFFPNFTSYMAMECKVQHWARILKSWLCSVVIRVGYKFAMYTMDQIICEWNHEYLTVIPFSDFYSSCPLSAFASTSSCLTLLFHHCYIIVKLCTYQLVANHWEHYTMRIFDFVVWLESKVYCVLWCRFCVRQLFIGARGSLV